MIVGQTTMHQIAYGLALRGFGKMSNVFSKVNKFVNESNRALSEELDNLETLSQQGIDITAMIEEVKVKVDTLQNAAKEMLEYEYSKAISEIENN